MTYPSKQNRPNPLHSAQDVNKTDSQDLMSELVGEFLRFSIDLDAETSAKRVLDITTAYTANKQKEIVEWVEQEVVGTDIELKQSGERNRLDSEINKFKAAQRKQLKNKKEEL